MDKPRWFPERFDFSSGLDVGLLGVIVAILGLYIGGVVAAGNYVPHLVRFADFQSPSDLPYVATEPQDSALIALLDESTRNSRAVEPSPLLDVSTMVPDSVSTALIALGLLLVVLGPLWFWMGRPYLFDTPEADAWDEP